MRKSRSAGVTSRSRGLPRLLWLPTLGPVLQALCRRGSAGTQPEPHPEPNFLQPLSSEPCGQEMLSKAGLVARPTLQALDLVVSPKCTSVRAFWFQCLRPREPETAANRECFMQTEGGGFFSSQSSTTIGWVSGRETVSANSPSQSEIIAGC